MKSYISSDVAKVSFTLWLRENWLWLTVVTVLIGIFAITAPFLFHYPRETTQFILLGVLTIYIMSALFSSLCCIQVSSQICCLSHSTWACTEDHNQEGVNQANLSSFLSSRHPQYFMQDLAALKKKNERIGRLIILNTQLRELSILHFVVALLALAVFTLLPAIE